MPKYNNKAREEFMADLDRLFNALDPTGTNTKYYHDKWDKVSDKEFDAWIEWLDSADENTFYWEIVEYERPATMDVIKNAAKMFDIELFEHVIIKHLNGEAGPDIVTPDKVPVGWIHIKRLPQRIHTKNHGSTSINKRNPKTGQVTGADKNARITDVETYALNAYGATNTLKEMLGFRADDEVAKMQAYNRISTDGAVYLNELESYPEDKAAINTLDVYYTASGMKTNIISGSKLIASPRVMADHEQK